MYSLTQYLETLENPEGLTRRLKGFELIRDANCRPIFHVGNRAIVFKIRHLGETLRLRCYTQPPNRNLERLYGDTLYHEELFLLRGCCGEWVDVVVEPWIEGKNLEKQIRRAATAGEQRELFRLSQAFEELATNLLTEPWAHGDLKPENIIVDPYGELHLIDFDGCYLPEERLNYAPEIGTPAYQHPQRKESFDKWIDHYPIALIATQIRALAYEPALLMAFDGGDGLLIDPKELFSTSSVSYKRYSYLLKLFAERGDAVHYRLAKLLTYPTYKLPYVESLLQFRYPLRPLEELESYYKDRLAGFEMRANKTPLLYDDAFDFKEGWALVRLGDHWHYIDRTLHPRYSLPEGCNAVKSLHEGKARYRIGEEWYEVLVK